ncbi:MAG: hypothetical protein WAQ25_03045 [Candidatus Saccharimonas sp.]
MATRDRFAIRTKRALRHLAPQHIIKARASNRTIQKFVDKAGLVYFGNVDPNDEGRRLVRGHTVSATADDDNYSVGTIRGYDVMVITRNDIVRGRPGQKEKRCHWLICTADLHTTSTVPHLYVGNASHEVEFLASYERLRKLRIGHYGPYSARFMSDYSVYGLPTDGLIIEQVITPQIADVMSAHFMGASVEIEDGTVYLYIENKYPTADVLEKMLSNCLWLAQTIDDGFTVACTVPEAIN